LLKTLKQVFTKNKKNVYKRLLQPTMFLVIELLSFFTMRYDKRHYI